MGSSRIPLPAREQTDPDEAGISTVTEYRYAADGTVAKHVMKVRVVEKRTLTSRAAIAREVSRCVGSAFPRRPRQRQPASRCLNFRDVCASQGRMKKFGAAATSSGTENITYYDLNLVKMRRPGDADESGKEIDDLISKLKHGVPHSSRDAAPAAAAGAAAGLATNTWARKFADAESKGIVGAAEAARRGGGPGDAAAASSGKYVPPALSGRPGTMPVGETEENTASLKVSNLADDVTEDQLRVHFGDYGRVTRVRIMSDHRTGESRGFGFVTFALRREAQGAKDELNKSYLNNMVMDIEWAKPHVRTGGPDSSMRHATGYGGKLPQGAGGPSF